jgi:hypothetical protein
LTAGAAATDRATVWANKQGQTGFEAITHHRQPKKNTGNIPTQNPSQTKDTKNNQVLDNESHET